MFLIHILEPKVHFSRFINVCLSKNFPDKNENFYNTFPLFTKRKKGVQSMLNYTY
uniref:Uncharacterized protein n=1 Tax=Anguilla anguilla TaxID=7936 RepID=A0A0E9WVZ2_ANGAN